MDARRIQGYPGAPRRTPGIPNVGVDHVMRPSLRSAGSRLGTGPWCGASCIMAGGCSRFHMGPDARIWGGGACGDVANDVFKAPRTESRTSAYSGYSSATTGHAVCSVARRAASVASFLRDSAWPHAREPMSCCTCGTEWRAQHIETGMLYCSTGSRGRQRRESRRPDHPALRGRRGSQELWKQPSAGSR